MKAVDAARDRSESRAELAYGERVLELARAASLGADDFLDLLAGALSRGPVTEPGVEALSDAEARGLAEAGVDLSGPPVGVDPQVSTAGEFARLLRDALDTDAAAALMRVSAGRVRQKLAGHTMYGVRVGANWRIPRWQFVGPELLAGLDRVVPALPPGLHPLAVERFMTHPNVDLEIDGHRVSPTQWLASGGDAQKVADLVTGLPAMP